jgi:hypothetical protein
MVPGQADFDVGIVPEHHRVIDVGPVGRNVVHVAAVLVGEIAPAPAVVLLHALTHGVGERNAKISPAAVGDAQVKWPVVGIEPRGRPHQLADDLDRETRLRGVPEVNVAEERDLDPALPAVAPQPDAERIEHRRKPGRHHERRPFQQGLGFVRHRDIAGRLAHVGRKRCAARLRKPLDRLTTRGSSSGSVSITT